MGTSGAGNAANFIAGRSESVTSPSPSYCEIPLSQGLVATVDAANFDYLNQWKWYAIWKENCRSFYAGRNAVVDGKKTTIYMHRQILGLSHGDTRKGDHRKTGDTLRNTIDNLRDANASQQQHNKRKYRNNSSGYKGVYFHKSHGKYMARIAVAGKDKFLGYRDTAEAAHRELYVPAAEKYHGEFARTM